MYMSTSMNVRKQVRVNMPKKKNYNELSALHDSAVSNSEEYVHVHIQSLIQIALRVDCTKTHIKDKQKNYKNEEFF